MLPTASGPRQQPLWHADGRATGASPVHGQGRWWWLGSVQLDVSDGKRSDGLTWMTMICRRRRNSGVRRPAV
jgi:hypothetical protein